MKHILFSALALLLSISLSPTVLAQEYLSPEEVLLLDLFNNAGEEGAASTAGDDEEFEQLPSAPLSNSERRRQERLNNGSFATGPAPIASNSSTATPSAPIAQNSTVSTQPVEQFRPAAPGIPNPNPTPTNTVINIPQPTIQPAAIPVQTRRPLAPTGAGTVVSLLALGSAAGWTVWRVRKNGKAVMKY